MQIQILLYDGCDELDAIGPYEVFDYAGEMGADIRVEYVTLTPVDGVTASHGTQLEVDEVLADPDFESAPDLLVVPGGGWNDRDDDASAWAEAQRGEIPQALAEYDDAGHRLASVCTGGMLLAEAGVTDGRPAVTHAGATEDLRETGAEVVDARVVDDGDLLTAAGVTSGLDLALHVVEEAAGGTVAAQVSEVIEYDRRHEIHTQSS